MKKLVLVSLKTFAFFVGWAICVSILPIPDTKSAAVWRFWAELIPLLSVIGFTIIFWLIDKRNIRLHLTGKPVYNIVLGCITGAIWLGVSVVILSLTGVIVGMGTLNSVLVHPREVFKSAILSNASSIILAHNHPSGDPEPSRHDIEVTKRLAEAGNLMGIEVLDHIVVAENRYFSFREENILPEYFQMEEVAAEQSLPYVKSEKEKVH